MGISNSYMSLGRIIGPLWAGKSLDLDIHYPFLTGAVIMLIAFTASIYYLTYDDHVVVNQPAQQDFPVE